MRWGAIGGWFLLVLCAAVSPVAAQRAEQGTQPHLVSLSCEIWSAIDLNVVCNAAELLALK